MLSRLGQVRDDCGAMTTTHSAPERAALATTNVGRAGRPPATAIAASGLALLTAGFGAYGAVYFTGLDGFTDLGLTFLVAYEFLSVLGIVSAIGTLRGRPLAHAGLVLYATWMQVFTAFKVGYIHETQAIPFAVVGLAVLVLSLAPATRRFVGR